MYTKDIINSAELLSRLTELNDELASLEYSEEWEDCKYSEHAMLTEIIDNVRDYSSDWASGVVLIKEEVFAEHIKSEYIELGLITDEVLNLVCVDWSRTAEKAACEYTEIDINGTTYMLKIN